MSAGLVALLALAWAAIAVARCGQQEKPSSDEGHGRRGEAG